MGMLVYVLGRSGTGKSYSMRNFPKNEFALVNVQGKILPFRGSGEIETTNTDQSEKVVAAIEEYAKSYKTIVVDDYQYLMSNEFMRRAYEGSWDKFTEIARHAWDIPDAVKNLPQDVIVYIMCHTDKDAEGVERLKTIGKLLDEKIFLEGMSTIVLKTIVSDGNYSFATQNNGKDTVKSPEDMFPSYAIDNDLYYVDQKIREYYGLGNTMTTEELEKADADAAHTEVQKPERKKRGTRKSEKEKEEPKEAPEEKEEAEKDIAEVVDVPEGTDDSIPFFSDEELKNEPKRKKRTSSKAETEKSQNEAIEASEEAPKPRRRRRTQ